MEKPVRLLEAISNPANLEIENNLQDLNLSLSHHHDNAGHRGWRTKSLFDFKSSKRARKI